MDVTCSICLSILFKPVHLPCKHQFCRDCIGQAVNFTAYQCPICRYRLSNWLRKVKDLDSVVSETKENEIRSLFPKYYAAKELGISPSLSELERKNMLNANTDFIPNCSAEAGDVHEYYVKEVEKYSSLRSLQEKENEEASLALAAQILSEDGLSLLADDISPEHLVNGCSVITNNSSPVSSSSNVTHINTKCKRKINKKTAKISKTLLDYAVDTDNAEINQEVKSQQILRDETFARRLQAQYSKLLSNLGEHKLPKRRK